MTFFKTTYTIAAFLFWGLSFFFWNEDWIFWTLIVGSAVLFGISEVLYEVRSIKTFKQNNDELGN
jgi:hypothetical protein